MKSLLILITFVFISCGEENRVYQGDVVNAEIGSQQTYQYSGILEVMDGANPCFGGFFYYIQYQGKTFNIGSKSDQTFNDHLKKIMDNEISYPVIDQPYCHRRYNFKFNGEITKELVFMNGSEIMTDVIHVQSFEIN